MVLPKPFTTATPLVFNVDYFDFVTNAGYKLFYPAGGVDSTGNIYFLTSDSTFKSDEDNYTSTDSTVDLDFDITFNNPATTAAADVFIQYPVSLDGGDTSQVTLAVTIYHYDGSTETSLGTVTGQAVVDGNLARKSSNAMKLSLTRKSFRKGDILRVNVVATVAGTGGGLRAIFWDPSGHVTGTDGTGGAWSSKFSVAIPFEVDL